MNKVRRLRLYIIFSFLFVISLFAFCLYSFKKTSFVHVTFFDIGQGDAALVETPSGKKILIDAGPDEKIMSRLSEKLSFWERNIDIMVATHPDTDHIGGFPYVLSYFKPTLFITSGAHSNNGVDEEVEKKLQKMRVDKNIITREAYRGQTIDCGDGVLLSVLYPDKSVVGLETNEASIVLRITYKETSFLFTGDAPFSTEFAMLYDNNVQKETVLKVGHHGSKSSTGTIFLEKVHPDLAILSVGAKNRYGHPAPVVLSLLSALDVSFLRTDERGSIEVTSDGKTIQVQTER